MRILYIHQLFKTPEEGGGIRSWYLAKTLVDAGHTVHMISSHDSKNALEMINGIHVHYSPIAYNNSFGFLRRLWAYGLFVLRARQMASSIKNVDLAYVMTTPLTTGFIATWIERKLSIPYYFEVGDLWPDVPVEMGVIKNAWLKQWLFKKEKEFYDQAIKIIALSPDIANNIRSKTNTPVVVIPNMADTEFFQPSIREREITKDDPLKILYCGAHGRANQLEFLINAARACQNLPIIFTLMGSGSEKARMMELATGLTNVTFLPHGSKEEVRSAIAMHDAMYISFQDLPVLHTGSPNKFFDALASGKMVISNLGGWTAELIRQHQLGFSYSGAESEAFNAQIHHWLTLDEVRKAQENSLALSKEYALEKLSKQLLASLENPV